jgi:hypothetical protein
VAVTAMTAPGSPAADLLSGDDAVFQVPSIFDVEVLSALRGVVSRGKFDGAASVLLTGDQRIMASPGARCDIQIIK